MPHIPLPPDSPGILGLFGFRPETARPLCDLAQTLLNGPSSLSPGERELIATYVSQLNGTTYCQLSHGATATALLGDRARVEALWDGGPAAETDSRLQALLAIAAAVTAHPQGVTPELVATARAAGADDVAIHDTVLVAAAFCMYNRYVDGLATSCSTDPETYRERGERRAKTGYVAITSGAPEALR